MAQSPLSPPPIPVVPGDDLETHASFVFRWTLAIALSSPTHQPPLDIPFTRKPDSPAGAKIALAMTKVKASELGLKADIAEVCIARKVRGTLLLNWPIISLYRAPLEHHMLSRVHRHGKPC